jgi:hypothetical protein
LPQRYKSEESFQVRVPFEDRFTIISTLRGCLHAPDAPLHLLSVGALDLTVTFDTFDAPTVKMSSGWSSSSLGIAVDPRNRARVLFVVTTYLSRYETISKRMEIKKATEM